MPSGGTLVSGSGSGVRDTGGVGPLEEGPLCTAVAAGAGDGSFLLPPRIGFFDLLIRSSSKLISFSDSCIHIYTDNNINTNNNTKSYQSIT